VTISYQVLGLIHERLKGHRIVRGVSGEVPTDRPVREEKYIYVEQRSLDQNWLRPPCGGKGTFRRRKEKKKIKEKSKQRRVSECVSMLYATCTCIEVNFTYKYEVFTLGIWTPLSLKSRVLVTYS
jgi:hypothetical protein